MARTQKSLAFPKPPLHNLDVHVSNTQKALPIQKRLVISSVRELLSFLKISCDEISICFVTEKKICELHGEFFDDPTPTDCITFPIDNSTLGEVYICPKTAVSYARERGLNPYDETLLYLIHGILHLIGYGDLEPAERRKMRKMEKKCMDRLKAKGVSLDPVSS